VAVGGRGLVDPSQPVLHADDEGLSRGRAAFETLRVYGGTPFRLDEHLERLESSAARLGIGDADADAFRRLARLVLDEAALDDAVLRLYLTAGREGGGEPRRVALVAPLPAGLEEMRARGVRLVSLSLGVDPAAFAAAPWLLGGVKSTSYAVNMAAAAEARARGADDAVFVAVDGTVLECPTANLWWRRGRTLSTPSLRLGILAGVTRAALLDLAGRLGYEVVQGAFPLGELASADEAFASSSVREVMPVAALDGVPLGSGPAAPELQAALRGEAAGSR
jgi:4-amino-4-deoxychorismate lyase